MIRIFFLPAFLLLGLLANSFVGAASLRDIESHGKQIYVNGTSPGGEPISAFLGVDRTELPASVAPCASCHGIDGRGRPEGGVVPSNITWSELSKSYGHEHDFGRRHAAFDDASLAASIIGGVDPAGNNLDTAMPRYRMAKDDIDALIAYIKRLEFDFDPGVSADVVRLGTLLPLSGPAASQGEAIRAVLTAFVEQLNAGGGINRRTVELDVIPLGETPAQTAANVRTALDSSGFFALVAIYALGVDADLVALLRDIKVPIVGPITRTPDTARDRLSQTYYLYAGKVELMHSLSQFAVSEESDTHRHQRVVGPDNNLLREVAGNLSVSGDSEAAEFPYDENGFSPTTTAATLQGTDDVFFLGTAAELDRLLLALAGAGKVPRMFLPAAVVTPSLLDAPAEFDGRVFVAYPTMPGDVSANGRQAYAALSASSDLPSAHLASQISALAAARVLVEAIQRAGHDLNREQLIAELESMNEFATGLTPPISFNLNRRIGALGAHIVSVDLGARRFVPIAGWMRLK